MSKTILVVDDSPSIRRMVSATLRDAGYGVVEATDGQDALAKAVAQPFAGVITDQNMPNMDGLGFIRAYRGRQESLGVPIIFLSTETEEGLKAQARAAGAVGWMKKPFEQGQLLAVIRKVVGP